MRMKLTDKKAELRDRKRWLLMISFEYIEAYLIHGVAKSRTRLSD